MHLHSPDIIPAISAMNISKLTTNEIEEQINKLHDRSETLKDIIKDIKDPATRGVLQLQQNNYKTTLDLLREELEKRNSGQSNA